MKDEVKSFNCNKQDLNNTNDWLTILAEMLIAKMTRKPGRGVAAPSLSRPMLIFYDYVQSLGALEFDEGTIYGYSEDVII
jgi:peptide deformylase